MGRRRGMIYVEFGLMSATFWVIGLSLSHCTQGKTNQIEVKQERNIQKVLINVHTAWTVLGLLDIMYYNIFMNN